MLPHQLHLPIQETSGRMPWLRLRLPRHQSLVDRKSKILSDAADDEGSGRLTSDQMQTKIGRLPPRVLQISECFDIPSLALLSRSCCLFDKLVHTQSMDFVGEGRADQEKIAGVETSIFNFINFAQAGVVTESTSSLIHYSSRERERMSNAITLSTLHLLRTTV